MSTGNSPVCINLLGPDGRLDITKQVSGGSFDNTINGFRQAQISLSQPLILAPRELQAFSALRITHARTAGVIWEGDLQDPNRSQGAGGPVWDLQALGRISYLEMVERPYIVIDGNPDSWVRAQETTETIRSAQTQVANNPDVGDGLQFSVPDGTFIDNGGNPGYITKMYYPHLQLIGQVLGAVVVGLSVAGKVNANQYQGIYTSTLDDSVTFTTALGSFSGSWVGTEDVPYLVWGYTTDGYTTDANDWCNFGQVTVRALLHDASGAPETGSFTHLSYVYIDDVIPDLIGSGLAPGLTLGNVEVPVSRHQFKHLAYKDPVTARQVLDDMAILEPGYYPSVWQNSVLNWLAFTSVVRYELDADRDEFRYSGSAADLYNAVTVRYINKAGIASYVRRTSTVAVLDDAGLTREAQLDLSNNIGISDTDAELAGDNFLADHSTVIRGGTVTVSRRVWDNAAARTVHPSEMRAGDIAVIKNVDPNPGSIGATASNGSTAFRVISCSYDIGTGACTVELGQFARSTERQIATNATVRRRRA